MPVSGPVRSDAVIAPDTSAKPQIPSGVDGGATVVGGS